jgi:hypothetical protein
MKRAHALLLTLLALSPACADDPDDVAAATGALQGGTPTSARPEIIQFVSTTGWCTATLIAPQYAITAAHCLYPQFTGITPDENTRVVLYDTNPEGEPIAVDRIHSFGPRYDYFSFQGLWGSTDVALVHLSHEVPGSRMGTAGLSPDLPYTGSRATLFGFGCTDRANDETGGYKQYVSFDYGTPTTSLCHGDSGGPAVLGNVGDGGAVYAVNSGWLENGQDAFGIASYYKPQIEKIIRDWDGNFERGFNRQGMDYTSFYTADAGACAYYCRNDGRCRSFSWVSNGTCWLKDGVPDPTPAPGIISGVPPVYEAGINRNGGDYKHFVPEEPRAELCGAACARDAVCASWTYVAPTSGGTGMCWLKTSVPAASGCSICTSGVMDRAIERGYDRNGGDLGGALSATSARACASECAKNEACRSFTFTGGSSNNCWLKGREPWASPAPSWSSGVRRGLEMDRIYRGRDYRYFATKPEPRECQATCARESQCAAWTYQPPPANYVGSAWCFLETSVPVPTFARGYVAGVKGMEFMP